jgi:murein DD-endopeptidase MepM/ murein hydrolase activator NlpD
VLALMLASDTLAHAQALRVDMRSRRMQPGELIAVRVTTPVPEEVVAVTAFGVRWPAYRVSDRVWRTLVGIDLDQKPGTYVLSVDTADREVHGRRTITVVPKAFRRRVLRVAPEYVNPPPDLLARITAEAELMTLAYQGVSPEPAWRNGFVRPVREPANSSFGTRSVFNGEPRNPHAGTDFLSPTGTPIHAPAGGRVVVARDLFFTGNTVVIDHGLAVFSMLAHLSQLNVHEGQDLSRGEVVGLVGSTGRVTGPHLHWALRVGHARVDAQSALVVFASGR